MDWIRTINNLNKIRWSFTYCLLPFVVFIWFIGCTNTSDNTSSHIPSIKAPAEQVDYKPLILKEISYISEDSNNRGCVMITWENDNTVQTHSATLHVKIADLPSETIMFEASDITEYITSSTVMDADIDDQEIPVWVKLDITRPDGTVSSIEETVYLMEPMDQCPVPDLDSIFENASSFYDCAELWASQGDGCGDDGYLNGYGKKYAERFYYNTRPKLSKSGKNWIDNTLVCLQHELKEIINTNHTCEEIKDIAYDSHPYCYTENGFCSDLLLGDLIHIFFTIDGKDLLGQEGKTQIIRVILLCLNQHITGTKQSDSIPNEDEFMETMRMLEKIKAIEHFSDDAKSLLKELKKRK